MMKKKKPFLLVSFFFRSFLWFFGSEYWWEMEGLMVVCLLLLGFDWLFAGDSLVNPHQRIATKILVRAENSLSSHSLNIQISVYTKNCALFFNVSLLFPYNPLNISSILVLQKIISFPFWRKKKKLSEMRFYCIILVGRKAIDYRLSSLLCSLFMQK